jgi:hypothetical protein
MGVPAIVRWVKLESSQNLGIADCINDAEHGLELSKSGMVIDKKPAFGRTYRKANYPPSSVAEPICLVPRLGERERRPRHFPRLPLSVVGDNFR